MKKNKNIEPVKLMAGILYRDENVLTAALDRMEKKFGAVECESERFPFSHTRYYEPEMGEHLQRLFISFETPISPDQLGAVKRQTNRIEAEFQDARGHRTINVDPGLVGLANLILASTKDFAHRIYLGGGIFAEITLMYENKMFQPLPWTYPDYQRAETLEFLLRVRESLKDFIITLRQKTG